MHEVLASPYQSMYHGDATPCVGANLRTCASESQPFSSSKSCGQNKVICRFVVGQDNVCLIVVGWFVLEGVCDTATILMIASEWLQFFRVQQCVRIGRRIIIIDEVQNTLGGSENNRSAVQCEKELRLPSMICWTNAEISSSYTSAMII